MKDKIISLIGFVFTVYGLLLCIVSNLNLGVILVAIIGVVILCIGIFHSRIIKFSNMRFFKICQVLIVIFLCVEIVIVSLIAVYGFFDNVTYNEDAIIVLGAGIRGDVVTLPLRMRLDKAVEYHHRNPKAFIVVTGGQGLQETVTEAFAMEKYLIQKGVDRNRIIKEEKATSTFENIKFSKVILDRCFSSDYSVAVITNNFHVFRGTIVAQKEGFKKVSHIHAGLQWYNIIPCFLRESLAVIKMFVLN